ncbi:MAG: hypothetical protein C4583_04495 [Anaerolineaceae bacterium]|nr:MAG: hypothetical protein C4583_04495 [Anaerolineaceae bacterium]
MKKLVPLLIALLGLALVIAAFAVWLEPPKDGGVFSTTGAIISFILGAGASIKGWMDVFKKDAPAKNETSFTATQNGSGAIAQGENPRAVGQQGVMAEQVSGGIINYGTIYQTPESPSPFGRGQGEGKNTLPSQPYFFGRAKELEIIASALSHESRTWAPSLTDPAASARPRSPSKPRMTHPPNSSSTRFSSPPKCAN